MDYLQILQLAIKYGPAVKGLIDVATSNADLVSKIRESVAPLAGVLEGLGAQFFPKVAPQIHIAAAAMASFDPNITAWVQKAINQFMSPTPPLVVDGVYGPKTRAAVEAFQAKYGLTVDGFAGQITQALISNLLTPKVKAV